MNARINTLLLTACSLFLVSAHSATFAETAANDINSQNDLVWARPVCAASEIVSGLCINPDMDSAVSISKSAAFHKAFSDTVAAAKVHLNSITPAANKVIITDLDETLVDNIPYYKRYGTITTDTWVKWLEQNKRHQYLPETLELLKYAKSKGFSVIAITGRNAHQYAGTLAQTTAIEWDGVFLKPVGANYPSSQFKTDVRAMLRKAGFEIVLNLGDQVTDMDLPLKDYKSNFLLPNVIYSIP